VDFRGSLDDDDTTEVWELRKDWDDFQRESLSERLNEAETGHASSRSR